MRRFRLGKAGAEHLLGRVPQVLLQYPGQAMAIPRRQGVEDRRMLLHRLVPALA